MANDSDNIPWAIFRPGLNSSPICGPRPFKPSASERKRAKLLLNRVTANKSDDSDDDSASGYSELAQRHVRQQQQQNQLALQHSTVNHDNVNRSLTKGAAPFCLAKDIKPGMVVSLMGSVIRVDGNYPGKCLMYISDYTSNELLPPYGEDNGNPRLGDQYGYLDPPKQNRDFPKGRMTLQVTLWEPHDFFARTFVQLNDIVHLTYVHIKNRRSYEYQIEASVHTDRQFPQRLHVHKVNAEEDDCARELLRRKRDYWRCDRTNNEPEEEKTNGTEVSSKNKKRKMERTQKRQEPKPEEGQKKLPSENILAKKYRANDYGKTSSHASALYSCGKPY